MKSRCPILAGCFITWVLLFASLTSLADEEGSKAGGDDTTHPPVFSIHDLDRDGLISREEYRRFLDATEQRRRARNSVHGFYRPPLRFDDIDVDGDGYLQEEELTSALNQRLEWHRKRRNRGDRW